MGGCSCQGLSSSLQLQQLGVLYSCHRVSRHDLEVATPFKPCMGLHNRCAMCGHLASAEELLLAFC